MISILSFRVGLATVVALVVASTMIAGCSADKPSPANDRTQKKKKSKDISADRFPGDTLEKRAVDEIAWKNKAAELLARVEDERSAARLVPELTALVKEREEYYARVAAAKERWNKAESDSLREKHGREMQEASDRYGEALKPFEHTTSKKPLADYLLKNHGIDLLRMKMVKREN